jgi:hypothetical protein
MRPRNASHIQKVAIGDSICTPRPVCWVMKLSTLPWLPRMRAVSTMTPEVTTAVGEDRES